MLVEKTSNSVPVKRLRSKTNLSQSILAAAAEAHLDDVDSGVSLTMCSEEDDAEVGEIDLPMSQVF